MYQVCSLFLFGGSSCASINITSWLFRVHFVLLCAKREALALRLELQAPPLEEAKKKQQLVLGRTSFSDILWLCGSIRTHKPCFVAGSNRLFPKACVPKTQGLPLP